MASLSLSAATDTPVLYQPTSRSLPPTLGLPPAEPFAIPFRCPDCVTTQNYARDDKTNEPGMAMADHSPRCPVCAYAIGVHDVVRDSLAVVKTFTTITTGYQGTGAKDVVA